MTKAVPNYQFTPAATAFEKANSTYSKKFFEDVRSLEENIEHRIRKHCEDGSTHLITTLDFLTDATTRYILIDKIQKDKALEIIHNDLLEAGYRVSEVKNDTIEVDWKGINYYGNFE